MANKDRADNVEQEKAVSDEASALLSSYEKIEHALLNCDWEELTAALQRAPAMARKCAPLLFKWYGIESPAVAEYAAADSKQGVTEIVVKVVAAAKNGSPAAKKRPARSRQECAEDVMANLTIPVMFGHNEEAAEHYAQVSLDIALTFAHQENPGTEDLAPDIFNLCDDPLRKIILKETQIAECPPSWPPKSTDAADAARILRWMLKNRKYLYFHPVSRKYGLDVAAREHGDNSHDYRATHPWSLHEGPNRTDVEKPIP